MVDYKITYKNEAYIEPLKTFDPVIQKGKDGKKVIIYKERTKDPNEGLSFTDFSLQSLIDADAADLLQPIAPLQGSQLSAADIANSAANNIGNFADNVKDETKE